MLSGFIERLLDAPTIADIRAGAPAPSCAAKNASAFFRYMREYMRPTRLWLEAPGGGKRLQAAEERRLLGEAALARASSFEHARDGSPLRVANRHRNS